jgi:UDP-N-acetylmuramyl pentapeptide synthase
VIDDTYNANPSSVQAALEVLAHQPKPLGMILGGMGELGQHSIEAHRQIGQVARSMAIQWLWTVGADAQYAAESFGANARHFIDVETLMSDLKSQMPSFKSVLVKGSRFNRLERVIDVLTRINGNHHQGQAACSTI